MTTADLLSLALQRAADAPSPPDSAGQLLAIASGLAAMLGAVAAWFTARASGGKSANDQYVNLTKDLRVDRDDWRTRAIAAEERSDRLELQMRHHVCEQFPHGIDPDPQSGPGRRGGTGGPT